MIAIINLLTNILITGTSIIGTITVINKIGKFCKTVEESKEDGYKIGFDNFMMESIDDMNKCVESVSTITSNVNNILFIIYDILIGNKFIKKNKEGKIIICGKSKVYSGYKDKIDELSNKVKKYEDELKKYKNSKNKRNTEDDSTLSSIITSDTDSTIESDTESNSKSDSESDSEDNKKKITKLNKKSDEEFYLET